MKNRRFVLVITDSTGRWVKRVGVARRTIELCVLAAVFVFVVGTVMVIHGITRFSDAAEAQRLELENQEFASLLESLQGRLPGLRRASLRASVSFDQLWTKSHLGVEPSLLAAGPTVGNDSGTGGPSAINGDVLSLEPIALPLEAERIDEDGTRVQYDLSALLEYFHDAERVLQHTPSIRPTHSTWTTSEFGRRRDPIFGSWLMHKGLDLGGQTGMEIKAPADGVVIFTGRRGGYGMTVVVHHGFGLQTHYAHLSRYLVAVGDRVQRGQVIALMGSTGKSTGPHLHYEVRRNGQPLDPGPFILD